MTNSQVVVLETTHPKDSIITASTSGEKNKTLPRPNPEECLEKGLWEVELVYYNISNGHRSLHNTLGVDPKHKRRGKVYKCLADNEYKCFEAHDGTVYWPGDCVYLESTPNEPYVVATISTFKPAKREQISMKLTRYYRPEDIPEVTYSLLVQERKEHGIYEKTLEYESRELFQNEVACSYPISYLRGQCTVKSYRNISELDEKHLAEDDVFFSCLNYNLDSNRLAAFHGTIRTGPRHQAELPPPPTESVSEDRDRDQLLYRPGEICQEIEEQYIKGCRTYRTFCLNKKSQIPQLERDSRLGDLVFDDAIVNLHQCHYNIERAKQIMEQHDNQLAEDNSFLTGEDVKKFTKGIKNYGKNFAKIQRELLPYHMREHLVNFYYMWKKSRDATRPRAIQRVRVAPKKAFKNGTPVRPASADLIDYASASEDELEDIEERACHHCYSTKSKDWHHSGIHRQLMCTDCRLYFKKYGNLRNVERPATVPPCLSRGSPVDEGVRTRANNKYRKNLDSPADEKVLRKSRKRIHRHSAMSDDLQDVPSPRNNGNKKKANSEPKEGEGSGSDSSSKSKKINGYQSSSSSASSPGSKEEHHEEDRKENGIKEEKENFYIKKEIEDDEEASCFLTQAEIEEHAKNCKKDIEETVSIIIKQDLKTKNTTKIADCPILEPVIFEKVKQRSKTSCARTDLVYHNPSKMSWTEKRKRREEREQEMQQIEKRKREDEEKMRAEAAARPSTSLPITSIPNVQTSMASFFQQQQQQKNALDLLNGVSGIPQDQMANVLQRIQMGAIPPMMPPGVDHRLFPHPMILAMQQEHQKMQALAHAQAQAQAQLQQQQEAAKLAEQRKLEEQKRQQEQRQREAAAAHIQAQMNGIKLPGTVHNPNSLLQAQQLHMMQQQFLQNPSLMAFMQHGHPAAQLMAAQVAHAEIEHKKRIELEIFQQRAAAQQAAAAQQVAAAHQAAAQQAAQQRAAEAHAQQLQQNSAAAALSQFAHLISQSNQSQQVPASSGTESLQMITAMMQQRQQQQQQQNLLLQAQRDPAFAEAMRKYAEARTV